MVVYTSCGQASTGYYERLSMPFPVWLVAQAAPKRQPKPAGRPHNDRNVKADFCASAAGNGQTETSSPMNAAPMSYDRLPSPGVRPARLLSSRLLHRPPGPTEPRRSLRGGPRNLHRRAQSTRHFRSDDHSVLRRQLDQFRRHERLPADRRGHQLLGWRLLHLNVRLDGGRVTAVHYTGEIDAPLAPEAYCAPLVRTCLQTPHTAHAAPPAVPAQTDGSHNPDASEPTK
jgi:hypothetical protein